MKHKTLYYYSDKEKVEFYIEGGFYFEELGKFITENEPLNVLLFVSRDKAANCKYFDTKNYSMGMQEFLIPTNLKRLKEFIGNEFYVEEFEFRTKKGMTISKPMWDDFLFTVTPEFSKMIDRVMIKAGLSETVTAFLKTHIGKFIQFDDEGNPIIKSEYSSLTEYFDVKYEEFNNSMNDMIKGKE